jgi:hypothetical protein
MATIGVSGPNLVLLPPITAAYPADHVLARVADELRRQGFRRVRVAPVAVEFGRPHLSLGNDAPAVGGGTCRLRAAGDDRWVRLELRYDHPVLLLGFMAAALVAVALPLTPGLRALALAALAAALAFICHTSARGMRSRIAAAVRRAP